MKIKIKLLIKLKKKISFEIFVIQLTLIKQYNSKDLENSMVFGKRKKKKQLSL
jgi:hypothetical protein